MNKFKFGDKLLLGRRTCLFVGPCDCGVMGCTFVRVKCPDGRVRSYPRNSFKLAGERQLVFDWFKE